MSEVWAPAPATVPRRKERWWLHVLLLALTFMTTTYVGAEMAAGFDPRLLAPSVPFAALLLRGCVTFSLPLLAILMSHEMGHYLTCRRYGIDVSPPYFIPFPSLVGTMGAFIRIREPIRNKKELFDMAVAGPIAGFLVTLPLLAWSVGKSRWNEVAILAPDTRVFHYPLLIQLSQKLLLGKTYTSFQVIEHPTFLAAWFGLFVTALNLLPLGQLDGGHTIYAVFGRFQRFIAIPLLVVLAVLGLKWPGWWVWVLFTLFTGIRHPRVLNEDEPLDDRRKLIAAAVLLIFVLCFAPVPIEIL
ncbi:MAG: site-2 protease family protein [Acidobacteriota bacterium]|nr:site-2 protease family protein [Acidobacteriota bacterium]